MGDKLNKLIGEKKAKCKDANKHTRNEGKNILKMIGSKMATKSKVMNT